MNCSDAIPTQSDITVVGHFENDAQDITKTYVSRQICKNQINKAFLKNPVFMLLSQPA